MNYDITFCCAKFCPAGKQKQCLRSPQNLKENVPADTLKTMRVSMSDFSSIDGIGQEPIIGDCAWYWDKDE